MRVGEPEFKVRVAAIRFMHEGALGLPGAQDAVLGKNGAHLAPGVEYPALPTYALEYGHAAAKVPAKVRAAGTFVPVRRGAVEGAVEGADDGEDADDGVDPDDVVQYADNADVPDDELAREEAVRVIARGLDVRSESERAVVHALLRAPGRRLSVRALYAALGPDMARVVRDDHHRKELTDLRERGILHHVEGGEWAINPEVLARASTRRDTP